MRARPATPLFRNFIVLADIIFAVTAGFMLLHPIRIDQVPPPVPAPSPLPPRDLLEPELQQLIGRLREGIAEIDHLAAEAQKEQKR